MRGTSISIILTQPADFYLDADTPLVFMHGYTNALEGDVCINYTGAEFYSKDDYQKTKESNLITNAMHCNLMFDDGRPMKPRLPKGITGWLAEALKV